jgi:hypothetical protein
MEKFEQKMQAEGLSQAAIDAFRLNYEQLVAGVTGLVRKGGWHRRLHVLDSSRCRLLAARGAPWRWIKSACSHLHAGAGE